MGIQRRFRVRAFGCGFALFIIVAPGCGSSGKRSAYDDDKQTSPTEPTGDGPSSPSGDFGVNVGGNVVLVPKNTTVVIDLATSPATPGVQAFTVLSAGRDVTPSATFTLQDPSLGTFRGATFTTASALAAGVRAKSTSVQAESSNGTAFGTLTVVQLRKTGAQRDFFFVVPYGETSSPKSDVLAFSTSIKQADVAFVVDTTSSMTNAIAKLKSALEGTLMAQLQSAIPNVGLAVVDYRDYGDDWVVKVNQVVTTSLALAQAGVAPLKAAGGGDFPEASIAAMEFALTGRENTGIEPHINATLGSFGGVDFRRGSVPVLVNLSDANWHDPSGLATLATLKNAFADTKARFVNIAEGFSDPIEAQADELSDATGSHVDAAAFGTVSGCAVGKCCTGKKGVGRTPSGPGGTCRLNFLSEGGNGVSSGIVKAIEAIAIGSSFDVTAKAVNDPTNANGVDATKFIKALRAMAEGDPKNGCPAARAKDADGDGINEKFVDLKAGTPVCFEVIPAMNLSVPPNLGPQFFNAFVDVVAVQGNLALDRRSVLFLVPPRNADVK